MHFLPEKIDNYVVSHSQQEPEILQELTRETWQKVLNPRMLSGAFQGRVLSMISKLIYPKKYFRNWNLYGVFCIVFSRRIISRWRNFYHR
jgi:hypothetical protein